MAPLALVIDPSATKDVILPASGALPGDIIALRPLHRRPGSKDRPLLYKVPPPSADPDEAGKGKRNKGNVVVSPAVGLSFDWVKTRVEVELQTVRSLSWSENAGRLI